MGYLKKTRDAKIRNGRPTRQERLDRKCYDREKFKKAHDQFLKCMDCAKWTLYGKTCNGVCEP